MRIRRSALGILLIAATTGPFALAQSGPTPQKLETHIEGWLYIERPAGGLSGIPSALSIDARDLGDQPLWLRGDDNPPLSAKAARDLSVEFKNERLASFPNANWLLTVLSLVPLDVERGLWCWKAEFILRSTAQQYSGQWPTAAIYILMDGSIIEPKEDAAAVRRHGKSIFKPKARESTN